MRSKNTEAPELIAKAIVWFAGKALGVLPVVGPVFTVVGFVADVAAIRKAYRNPE